MMLAALFTGGGLCLLNTSCLKGSQVGSGLQVQVGHLVQGTLEQRQSGAEWRD